MENLGLFGSIVYFGIVVICIASLWKIYEKAGKPGWTCLIPIYNIVVLLEIVNKPWWWLLLLMVPIVNIIVLIMITHLLSKSFGKSVGFTVGLVLFGFVFYPVLGFGGAEYNKAAII